MKDLVLLALAAAVFTLLTYFLAPEVVWVALGVSFFAFFFSLLARRQEQEDAAVEAGKILGELNGYRNDCQTMTRQLSEIRIRLNAAEAELEALRGRQEEPRSRMIGPAIGSLEASSVSM